MKAKNQLHWFRFFPADYFVSTNGWPSSTRLAFLELMFYQFGHGSVPDDQKALRRICRMDATEWKSVEFDLLESAFPLVEEGVRKNPDMESERVDSEKKYNKRVNAARASHQSRRSSNVVDLNA